MDIPQLLKGVNCSCGRHHSCDISFVAIEKGAISHLTALTNSYRSVLLVADENTFRAAGTKTEAACKLIHLLSDLLCASCRSAEIVQVAERNVKSRI